MSLADLRKELKDIRKKAMPVAVSKMKKADIAMELARLRSMHSSEVKKVEEVLVKEEVPKKVAKKVAAVQEVEHKKQETVVKAPKKSDDDAKKEAMKEKMAKLREMRKKKSSE